MYEAREENRCLSANNNVKMAKIRRYRISVNSLQFIQSVIFFIVITGAFSKDDLIQVANDEHKFHLTPFGKKTCIL